MKLLSIFILGFGVLTQTFANDNTEDPAQITIGERLFLETRFAQAYYADVNKPEPALEKTLTVNKSLPGAYAGQTMNCRACHLVDEFADHKDGGTRTYSDYTRMSPIPDRQDGNMKTGRNSMSLVNISVPLKQGMLFHFDGEFNSMEDLVRGTLTGRNYGWQAHESNEAIAHIASIIRSDSGNGDLAKEFGGAYRKILNGTDTSLPKKFILPAEYRIDIDKAGDQQIVDAVARLISAYVLDLNFTQDDDGNYSGSPYDAFLKKNNLPRKPENNESLQTYSQRLLLAVNKITTPRFISDKDQKFSTHKQEFVFAKKELSGMKLFFSPGNKKQPGGNCVSCHSAPHFSDYKFHNTGLTQLNYDNTHGSNSFNQLDIPGLKKRNANHDAYLPATAKHPKASSRFRSAIAKQQPGHVDLGVWNIFANPDMPTPQQKMQKILCKQADFKACKNEQLLDLAIATFKTPVLRDLGHSAPYMHTGQFDRLESAVSLYITNSAMSREKKLRNNDPALSETFINLQQVEPLVAFLKSLNEDYD